MRALVREGDVITVAGVIVSDPIDFDGVLRVKVAIKPYHSILVLASDVTVVRPDFRVGDKVEWAASGEGMGSSYTGYVLSIANDHLWVDMGDGNFATVWASNATRVDPKGVIDPDFDEVEDWTPPEPPSSADALLEAERLEDERLQAELMTEPTPELLDGKVGSEEEA